jgi:hypothetical protein
MSADDAVESITTDVVRLRQVSDNCGERIRIINVKYIQLLDRCAAEPRRIPRILKLKAVAAYIAGELPQELLKIIAIDRQAPI